MAVSLIGGGNRRKPLTCRMSLTNFITKCCIEYTLPLAGFKLTTLVVIGTESVIAQVFVNPTTMTTPLIG
jgi:hypothetical protein